MMLGTTNIKFLTMKPTRSTNFSNLFLEWSSTCFEQFLCPSWGVFHCTHNNGICHTGLLTACEQDPYGTSWSCSCSTAVYKPVWHIPLLCVQWKTPDDGQRNCPNHAEFHSKNKFEKLVHLVGFITGMFLVPANIWNWQTLPSPSVAAHSNVLEDDGNEFYCFMCYLIEASSPLRHSNYRIVSPNPDHDVFAVRWTCVGSIRFRGNFSKMSYKIHSESIYSKSEKNAFQRP